MASISSLPSSSTRPRFGSASKTEKESSPHVPVLALDADGTIQHSNGPARRVLEYASDASINPCFFSHIHGHNLRRVMRDLAHMVRHRKPRARWLLRLRTGNGRWRWYRAIAQNQLDAPDALIRVRLRPL